MRHTMQHYLTMMEEANEHLAEGIMLTFSKKPMLRTMGGPSPQPFSYLRLSKRGAANSANRTRRF